jgi:hypothetical protein
MAAAAHAVASQADADLEAHAVAGSSGLTTHAGADLEAAAVAGDVAAVPLAAVCTIASQGALPASGSQASRSGGGVPSLDGISSSSKPSSAAAAAASGSSAGGGGRGTCQLLQGTQMFFAPSQQLGELLLSDGSQDGL